MELAAEIRDSINLNVVFSEFLEVAVPPPTNRPTGSQDKPSSDPISTAAGRMLAECVELPSTLASETVSRGIVVPYFNLMSLIGSYSSTSRTLGQVPWRKQPTFAKHGPVTDFDIATSRREETGAAGLRPWRMSNTVSSASSSTIVSRGRHWQPERMRRDCRRSGQSNARGTSRAPSTSHQPHFWHRRADNGRQCFLETAVVHS